MLHLDSRERGHRMPLCGAWTSVTLTYSSGVCKTTVSNAFVHVFVEPHTCQVVF